MTEYCISFLNISDEGSMLKWAISHCKSFVYQVNKDVRTDSGYDNLYQFYFTCEKDAMWFRLHWQ